MSDVICPRCGTTLARTADQQRWRCEQCRGVATTARELVAQLRAAAPDLGVAPPTAEAAAAVPVTISPRDRPLACPTCRAAMTPLVCGPVTLDRCAADDMLWFDDWEHVTVLAAARAPRQPALLEQLLRTLTPDDPAT